jgi:hypothetical protein
MPIYIADKTVLSFLDWQCIFVSCLNGLGQVFISFYINFATDGLGTEEAISMT